MTASDGKFSLSKEQVVASRDSQPPTLLPDSSVPALPERQFVEWLKREGLQRYHHRHPFNLRMHSGQLTKEELRCWVYNRYYYQTRIPLKDALIVAKSEDPAFRRAWLTRIQDHDGHADGEGGLWLWQKLAEAVGLDVGELVRGERVLPAARRACDSYVEFVRGASLLEAVASTLTEAFAKDLMAERLAAWQNHYPWVDAAGLDYFRSRVVKARSDSEEALAYVVSWARSYAEQARAVEALLKKTHILWSFLDAVEAGCPPGDGDET
ncbi:MAG TPA: pyrroloquinoline-quinone synthase PqqC [Polyangiaceae bacterium]